MNFFERIDRDIRVGILVVLAVVFFGGLSASVVCCADPPDGVFTTSNKPLVIISGKTEQIPDANQLKIPGGFLVDQGLSGIGTLVPTQQLQLESSARFCSGADHSCLPMQITEYFAAAPSVTFRRAEGTLAAPTALTFSGEGIAQLRAQGYTTTGFVGLPQVWAEVGNAEPGSPTATAQGTYLQFRTVGIGTTNSAGALKIDSDQNVAVGPSFDNETVPYGFTTLGSIGNASIIQPVPIVGGTVNSYAPVDTLGSGHGLADAYYVRQFCSGTVTITSIAGGLGITFKGGVPFGSLGGREFTFDNIGSGTCTFPNETGPVLGDRILTPGATDVVVPTEGALVFWYDSIVLRWKIKSRNF